MNSNFLVNRNIIFRMASMSTEDLIGFYHNDSNFYSFVHNFFGKETKTKLMVKKLMLTIFDLINKECDLERRRVLLSLKRKISKWKVINKQEMSSIKGDNLLLYYGIEDYNSLIKEYKYLLDIKKFEYVNKERDIDALKLLIELSKQGDFRKALILASPDFVNELQKREGQDIYYLETKKINDLKKTLYKYISRSTYKTSPFSYFCFQGVAKRANKTVIDEKIVSVSSLNLTQANKFYLSKSKVKFYVNENIFFDEIKNNVKIIKKSGHSNRGGMFQDVHKIITLEYSKELEKLWVKYKGIQMSRNEMERIIMPLTSKDPSTKDFFQTLEESGVIESNPYYYSLKDYFPPSLKEINLNNYDRPSLLRDYEDELKQTPKIYEDIFFEEKIHLGTNDLNIKRTVLEGLTKLSYIFDESVINRYNFISCVGENKELNMGEIIDYILEFDRSPTQGSYEANEISKIRQSLYKKIKNGIKRGDKEIHINLDEIENKYKRMPHDNNPYSATFFFQPIDDLLVLNKIFSGFGRMFMKFKPSVNDALRNNLINYKRNSAINFDFLEIFSLYGFNGNVHSPITNLVLDYENLIPNTKRLGDLRLNINFDSRLLELRLNNKRVFPIHLGALSTRMYPTINKYLLDLFHFDTINLDLHKLIPINYLNDEKVQRLPRVTFENIIISREKWIINMNTYFKELKQITDESLYTSFIKDSSKGLFPEEFYIRPLEIKNLNNVNQLNDILKPQYINLKSKTSFEIMLKLSRRVDILILEEATPNQNSYKKVNSKTRAFELGVETYL